MVSTFGRYAAGVPPAEIGLFLAEVGEYHSCVEVVKRIMAAKMKTQTKTRVFVYQASTVELTKRGSKDSLEIYVRKGTRLLGTLALGRGSVEWRPEGHSVNKFRKGWGAFATMLDREMKK